jgi:hypothetical protein
MAAAAPGRPCFGQPLTLLLCRSSSCLAVSGCEFLQDAARDFLQFAKSRQVVLKVVIERLRVLRAKLRAQDHVAQFHGMWQQRVFLQLFESGPGVVVIHELPRRKKFGYSIVLARASGERATGNLMQAEKSQAADAATGRNS